MYLHRNPFIILHVNKQAGWSQDHGLPEEKHRIYIFLIELLETGIWGRRGVTLYVTHPYGMQYIDNIFGIMGRTISEIGRID